MEHPLYHRRVVRFLFAILLVSFTGSVAVRAQDQQGSDAASLSRYGFFSGLDHRSQYGLGSFPEPFIVDDSDLETNELRFDWLHQEKAGKVADGARVELEKGIGALTLELEVHYDRSTDRIFEPLTQRNRIDRGEGISNINIGARYPFYQFVSRDERIDNTLGAALEIGIPTNSPTGKHAEIVPKVFNDLRLGDHFTFQTVVGLSFLRGSKPDGGAQALEYGVVLGYRIPHGEMALPGVEQIIPMFEVAGSRSLNHGAGVNNILGNAAFRLNLRSIGRVQPRLGVGYLFPMNSGARDDFRWGVATSLVFEW